MKGVHDLELKYNNYGAFVRGKWWYDRELENGKQQHGHEPNSNAPDQELDDSNFNDFAAFSGVELLDAFVFGEFEIDDRNLDLRLGRQVVSWGESTFIQGSINTINPIDASAFRRPGAEIKEGLLPVNLIYGNVALTENLSLEAFFQLEWEKTVIDGCGTYFSSNDFAPDGCDRLAFAASIPDQANYGAGTFMNRTSDQEADDDGQYGLSLRYYAEELDTEFGAYYINYHSRLPYVSALKSSNGLPMLAGGTGVAYLIAYPEDIKLYGLSFSTNIGTLAVSGEISHRLDLPLQINGNELLAATLGGSGTGSTFGSIWDLAPNGTIADGFERFDYTQAQVTLIKFFDRALGSSRITLVSEIGVGYVHDLPDTDEQRFGRGTVFGRGSAGADPDDGFVTDFSWGYRVKVTGDYPNVLAGVNLKPSISWKHDVEGFSPGPGAQFQESRQALSLALNAEYNQQYSVGISYTNFLDSGDYDLSRDRDFISLSASVAF